MSRKRSVPPDEILANPGRRAVAHRLDKASNAVKANNTSFAVDMINQADSARCTLGMTWAELVGIDVAAT